MRTRQRPAETLPALSKLEQRIKRGELSPAAALDILNQHRIATGATHPVLEKMVAARIQAARRKETHSWLRPRSTR